MDLQSLSAEHMEKLVCSSCLQYLSVLPVFIKKNGETVCGRCDQLHSNIQYSKHTMFNLVAERFLFKCINHFEGCTQFLNVKETIGHEKICQHEDHECFFCSFTGSWSQIVHHCTRTHPENLTNDGLFQFEVGSEFMKRLVYVVNSNIFLLTITITEKIFSLLMSPKATTDFIINQFAIKFFVPSDFQSTEISFVDYSLMDVKSVNLFEKHGEELISDFGRKTNICCQIILNQVVLSQKELELEKKWHGLKLREMELNNRKIAMNKKEFTLKRREETIESFSTLLKAMAACFNCSNCKKLLSEAVYFCPKGHFYCETCLTPACKNCNKICDFTKVSELVSVSCDWPGCRMLVKLPNYVEHKYKCPLRPYKCPMKDCPEMVYSSEKLKDHWHSPTLPLITESFILYEKYGDYECYWLTNTELYSVMIRFLQTNLQIMIDKVNVISETIDIKIEGSWGNKTSWELIKLTDFCGKYQVISSNLNIGQNTRYTAIKFTATEINK